MLERGLTDFIWKLIEGAWAQNASDRPTFMSLVSAFEVAAGAVSGQALPSVFVKPTTQIQTSDPASIQQKPTIVTVDRDPPSASFDHLESQTSQPFPCGLRMLVNVRSENVAFLPDANSYSDIVGSNPEGRRGEKVCSVPFSSIYPATDIDGIDSGA